jgi:pyrimidine operon attenuation protein/uracil phosphoribosyltransferase
MDARLLLTNDALNQTMDRLAYQVFERHLTPKDLAIIALQPRGVYLGRRILKRLMRLYDEDSIRYGELDITFHRDDFRRRDDLLVPAKTTLDFGIEGLQIVLVDDVLYTGRTVRAGLDAMLDFGRPAHVELMTLIDRRYSRELPVQPDYTGRVIDVVNDEMVKVNWSENDDRNEVTLFGSNQTND